MNHESELQKLYDRIPKGFVCKEKCHSCCGMINWLAIEEEPIRKFMKEHNIQYVKWTMSDYLNNQLLCPYLKGGECVIYPVRPLICRLYGHTKKLACPHNSNLDISPAKESYIMRKYHELNNQYIKEVINESSK